MALDYSEKRLVSEGLHTRGNSKRARRLHIYAVLTGFLSLLISIATLVVMVLKK